MLPQLLKMQGMIPNDLLAFIAFVEFVHNSDYNSDSDEDKFTDEQKVEFLSNLVIEHE